MFCFGRTLQVLSFTSLAQDEETATRKYCTCHPTHLVFRKWCAAFEQLKYRPKRPDVYS